MSLEELSRESSVLPRESPVNGNGNGIEVQEIS